MFAERYDLVIYGASGFTGAYVLKALVKSEYNLKFAIAGRNLNRLQNVLTEVSKETGKDLKHIPIIIADSKNENELIEMAKQAKIIVNIVGPYRLYGEAVVKAAVENGASHIDISGEPAWLELMQMKYNEIAKVNNVYVVGASGWDSIPCDLGINWLKENFDGTVCYAETFAQIKNGEAGYSFNAGTYQTLILGLWQAKNDGLGQIRKTIMPEKLQKAKWRPPKRKLIWWNQILETYCLPFMGADKSVVQRSQYYDSVVNHTYPITIETYIAVKNYFWSILLILWLSFFNWAVKYDFTRKILQKYPGFCSGYLFKENGPTAEQIKQASFTYWFIAHGWSHLKEEKPNFDEKPNKSVIVRCDGPDAGYVATAGCVLSSALTILFDKNLPKGGVYTTASAFKNTEIYKRLESFGITFRIDSTLSSNV